MHSREKSVSSFDAELALALIALTIRLTLFPDSPFFRASVVFVHVLTPRFNKPSLLVLGAFCSVAQTREGSTSPQPGRYHVRSEVEWVPASRRRSSKKEKERGKSVKVLLIHVGNCESVRQQQD